MLDNLQLYIGSRLMLMSSNRLDILRHTDFHKDSTLLLKHFYR